MPCVLDEHSAHSIQASACERNSKVNLPRVHLYAQLVHILQSDQCCSCHINRQFSLLELFVSRNALEINDLQFSQTSVELREYEEASHLITVKQEAQQRCISPQSSSIHAKQEQQPNSTTHWIDIASIKDICIKIIRNR
jgi:hypothetical protein